MADRSSAGTAGWRPPANATSISLGPWVSCHCSHNTDEDEIQVGGDLEQQKSSSTRGRSSQSQQPRATEDKQQSSKQTDGAKYKNGWVDASPLGAKSAGNSIDMVVSEPKSSNAVGQNKVSFKQPSSSALAPAQPYRPEPRTLGKCLGKACIAVLASFVCIGLVVLGVGRPFARQFYRRLENHTCRLSSSRFVPDQEEVHALAEQLPVLSCWVDLDVKSTNCEFEESSCWEPPGSAFSGEKGLSLLTFEASLLAGPALHQGGCSKKVQEYFTRSDGFDCSWEPGNNGGWGIFAMHRERLLGASLISAELLADSERMPSLTVTWIISTLLLTAWLALRVCLLLSHTFCSLVKGRRCHVLLYFWLSITFIGLAFIVARYPAARLLHSHLHDARCRVSSPEAVQLPGVRALSLPYVNLSLPVPALGAPWTCLVHLELEDGQPLDGFRDAHGRTALTAVRYRSLGCASWARELNSIGAEGFECAYARDGIGRWGVFMSHNTGPAELCVLTLSMSGTPFVLWALSACISLVVIVFRVFGRLLDHRSVRAREPLDGYRQLAGAPCGTTSGDSLSHFRDRIFFQHTRRTRPHRPV
eukprot:TRINITY_DN91747_c0_g1_i1.p1 TRINITY_DN91747_c0_g1~~TRINITY_DN91747_c0_g1_i1.p1  ORF type:complete len:588 (+),score=66.23 TRINITY_DN91747_c0_g1_i1:60-1823(+)